MGIYQYTLRAATKSVGDVEIGQFKFAYKCGSDWHRDSREPSIRRMIRSMQSKAEDAAHKLSCRQVTRFVKGDWYDGQPVFFVDRAFSEFTEELRTAPVIGYLRKDGRGRWYYDRTATDALLQAHQEVGVLQTEDGVRYYVNGGDRRFEHLYDACHVALQLRLYRY